MPAAGTTYRLRSLGTQPSITPICRDSVRSWAAAPRSGSPDPALPSPARRAACSAPRVWRARLVCPTSVVSTWQREPAQFAPSSRPSSSPARCRATSRAPSPRPASSSFRLPAATWRPSAVAPTGPTPASTSRPSTTCWASRSTTTPSSCSACAAGSGPTSCARSGIDGRPGRGSRRPSRRRATPPRQSRRSRPCRWRTAGPEAVKAVPTRTSCGRTSRRRSRMPRRFAGWGHHPFWDSEREFLPLMAACYAGISREAILGA